MKTLNQKNETNPISTLSDLMKLCPDIKNNLRDTFTGFITPSDIYAINTSINTYIEMFTDRIHEQIKNKQIKELLYLITDKIAIYLGKNSNIISDKKIAPTEDPNTITLTGTYKQTSQTGTYQIYFNKTSNTIRCTLIIYPESQYHLVISNDETKISNDM